MNHRTVRTAFAAVACAGVSLGLMSAPAQAATSLASSTTQKADPRATAIAAADRAVASGLDRIVQNPNEKYNRAAVTDWVKNLYSVSYERSYKGLDVVGGDAVVLVDGTGVVRATSSATTATVNVPTTATITAAAARATARRRLAKVTKVESTRLIVWMRDNEQHLAYEVVLDGATKTRPSRLHVDVDALTGAVVHTFDDVHAGSGQGAWNGPNPLALDTTASGGQYSMTDPTRPGVACADFTTGSVFRKGANSFGNGNPTSVETGCVDALYDTQTEWDMLGSWLGRNGLNGSGGGWTVKVGLNDMNAYWDGSTVSIGHNQQNQWISSMDVVGHENGHGIDTYTPGGADHENGLGEGTGDIFGALTEAYANQPSPYDTPDFTVGESINLVGNGPIRYMYNPSILGDPNCYSSSIPTTEVHSAAGPLNHWFYLLAEGSNPGGSNPSSPTCNGTSVSGVGVQDAGRIFYGGMLLKTTNFSFKKYRTATLTSAKNLDPSCALYARTKAAWDAVSVPAQAGDPTCSGGSASDFSMAITPATGTVAAGQSTTATVATTSSGPAQSVALTASGAPSGVTVNLSPSTVQSGSSSTMTITAASTVPTGTYAITVDGAGSVHHTATFTLKVTGSGGGGTCTANLVSNGGFESGASGWTVNSTGIITNSAGQTAHSGAYFGWFDGYGTATTNTASQKVAIPAGCTTAALTYYLHVDTAEASGSSAYDTFTVKVNGTTVASSSNRDSGAGYTKHTVNLGSYAGSTVTLLFTGSEDSYLYTSFVLDDVSVAGA